MDKMIEEIEELLLDPVCALQGEGFRGSNQLAFLWMQDRESWGGVQPLLTSTLTSSRPNAERQWMLAAGPALIPASPAM